MLMKLLCDDVPFTAPTPRSHHHHHRQKFRRRRARNVIINFINYHAINWLYMHEYNEDIYRFMTLCCTYLINYSAQGWTVVVGGWCYYFAFSMTDWQLILCIIYIRSTVAVHGSGLMESVRRKPTQYPIRIAIWIMCCHYLRYTYRHVNEGRPCNLYILHDGTQLVRGLGALGDAALIYCSSILYIYIYRFYMPRYAFCLCTVKCFPLYCMLSPTLLR